MFILDWLFGRPLASSEEHHEKIGAAAGVPVLGLDALASAAYGPEAALTLLIPLGMMGIGYAGPILALIIGLLILVYLSYRQTIAAYPSGGGSYIVARENLGDGAGLVAAAALLLDYVLVVAVGISAGVGALISAVPSLQPYTLPLCLLVLLLITVINLRGVRESGLAFLFPTYLFVFLVGGVLFYGLMQCWLHSGHPTPVVAPPQLASATGALGVWVLVQAFASGCTAMTGVEAVSNGVPVFREPRVANAQRCLTAIIVILVYFLAVIGLLCKGYGVAATTPGTAGYESVLSQLLGAIVGKGWIYGLGIASVLGVLALSANTGFADFPRLCQILALDDFLPRSFASQGRRLVFSNGILLIALLSAGLLVLFGGVTDRLIPLFAIGAFGAFTLSQLGMLVHWRRIGGRATYLPAFLNGLGAVATGATLLVVLVAKFHEGAWITLLLVPACVWLFVGVRRHYRAVGQELACSGPLECAGRRPVVVVPLSGWSRVTQQSLSFALSLSPEVHCVRVLSGPCDELSTHWESWVEEPARRAGLNPPRLVQLESPYRRIMGPLLEYVRELRGRGPVVVVIGELVERRWYHYLLHNQHAQVLKAMLYLQGGPGVVVVSVPWHLRA